MFEGQTDLRSVGWTEVERELLRALAIQIKYLTAEQVERGWGPKGAGALDTLTEADLLVCETLEVYELEAPVHPLYNWSLGEDPPTREQLAELSEQLANRWGDGLQAKAVYRASRQAANLFGARSNEPARSSEWSHDLLLSDVFLRYRELQPAEAAQWFGESYLPKLGLSIKHMKDPDAFLLDGPRISRIIEAGGKYTVEHLQDLHDHCAGGAYRRLQEFAERHEVGSTLSLYANQFIPYEIW